MIEDADLLSFVNETIRPIGDRLAGLLPFPDQALAAVKGKGFAEKLGTKDGDLIRAEPWTEADYGNVAPHDIQDSGSGGRTTLTNHDVIGLLRVLIVLGGMMKLNPQLAPLVAKIAVNPRA